MIDLYGQLTRTLVFLSQSYVVDVIDEYFSRVYKFHISITNRSESCEKPHRCNIAGLGIFDIFCICLWR